MTDDGSPPGTAALTAVATMPYNTSAIAPSADVTGTTRLPFARVKKIIATDPDINIMSNAGVFVISLATEMFIQHLAEQGHQVARTDRKPRRNLQYRDLATAVANQDRLEFLADIVPKTVTVRQIRERRATVSAKADGNTAGGNAGQICFGNANPVQNDVGPHAASSESEKDLGGKFMAME
ncbi:hypothetical protein K3495_g363 [Podosphaera aphanis]|nr:hypothetical protein K3495_g363 [Podosphaera aphanis]